MSLNINDKSINDLPTLDRDLLPGDVLPIVRGDTKKSARITIATLDGRFGQHVEPPLTKTDPGAPGQWAVDATYLYVYTTANVWGRVPTEWLS